MVDDNGEGCAGEGWASSTGRSLQWVGHPRVGVTDSVGGALELGMVWGAWILQEWSWPGVGVGLRSDKIRALSICSERGATRVGRGLW